MWQVPEEIRAQLDALLKRPLASELELGGGEHLERADIETLLPHRGQALLLERAELFVQPGVVIAHHRLEASAGLLAGHFPGDPLWPGVLQIEGIGQAGLLLARRQQVGAGAVRLLAVLGARFMAAVVPPTDVELRARLLPDGLFCNVVGQCLQAGQVRSVAALRLMVEED
jgi:3-hydroxymyristoyl/3-hydroxydecanoyl-(acyl carrier protein) dehydratase